MLRLLGWKQESDSFFFFFFVSPGWRWLSFTASQWHPAFRSYRGLWNVPGTPPWTQNRTRNTGNQLETAEWKWISSLMYLFVCYRAIFFFFFFLHGSFTIYSQAQGINWLKSSNSFLINQHFFPSTEKMNFSSALSYISWWWIQHFIDYKSNNGKNKMFLYGKSAWGKCYLGDNHCLG